MIWPTQTTTVYVREDMPCYVCGKEFRLGQDKPFGKLKEAPICGRCVDFLPKFPKFGYEKPSPPKEMAEAA